MKRFFFSVLGGSLILALGCGLVWAQATAQISGTARDQSGAVLPGVEITVTQTETGITRSVVTNETGSYVLPNLPVGPYRLEAALPGFRTYAQSGIVLQVNSSPAINVVLEVGQVAETVEVQANAALVETRTVGIGQVVENARILDLPLDGRQVTELIALAGGAVPTSLASPGGTAGGRNPYSNPTVSVAGGLNTGLNYSLDGANHNDPFDNASMSVPFPDALQEFKVETSATSAQTGVRPAGSVSLVTKSGTNEFHGNLFEFVRNGKFNARNAFATRRDTMKRNQFGGTLGGPIFQNKLFFFAGYQGGTIRQDPVDRIAFVPTAEILAGDFTAFASPACNRGQRITLRAPFVNNRVDPTLFSKPAVALANKLPKTSDPCGRIIYGSPDIEDRHTTVARIDYQRSANHSLFGRYLREDIIQPTPYSINKNPLSVGTGLDGASHAFTLGLTSLYGANVVNAIRLSGNRFAGGYTDYDHYFGWGDLGVKAFTYVTDSMDVDINGAFHVGTRGGPSKAAIFAINDDLSVVRGNHQMAFGAHTAAWWTNTYSDYYAVGRAVIDGQKTGLGMADYFLGYVSEWTMGSSAAGHKRSKYVALYGADTWKVNSNITLNYGLRWEPFFPMIHRDDSALHFDMDALRRGTKTSRFTNAPPGLFFTGDPGFPARQGQYNQWRNFSPRVGLAWDVAGDGRASVRASVGTFYDYPNMHYQVGLHNAPPWQQRVNVTDVQLDDPWASWPGGDPFPVDHGKNVNRNVVWQPFSIVTAMDYDSPNTMVTHWNLSLQRQIGADWLVSASYIGNATTHLWGTQPINPAIYIPGVGDANGNCFLNGQPVPYTVRRGADCSTTRNINDRRRLMLDTAVPRETAQYYGPVNRIDTGGTASYNGLVLSVQRRVSGGVTINANHTWSHCISDWWSSTANSGQATTTWLDPDNRRFDRGNCISGAVDRRHVFNVSAVAETPRFSSPALRAVGSGWRFSPILRVLTGSYMSVTTRDRALIGTRDQRVNQILPNVYGKKSVEDYLNPAAFAQPATGTLGNVGRGSIAGPGSWQFDVAFSRTFQFREAQRVEFRAEAFNVTNSFRMNNPETNFTRNTFGQVTSARDPRIMQFALKYFF